MEASARRNGGVVKIGEVGEYLRKRGWSINQKELASIVREEISGTGWRLFGDSGAKGKRRKKGKGWHATKEEDPRRTLVALMGVEAKKRRVRPKREGSTVVMKTKAEFEGQRYTVYAKEGTTIRTIFPRLDRHPRFAKAPFGKKFRVKWKGKEYEAVKEARWQENGARVPCLVWHVTKEAERR